MSKIQTILSDLHQYKKKLTSIEDLDNKGVHNFSLPVLNTYFNLDEIRNMYGLIVFEGNILLLPSVQGRFKSFCFNPENDKIQRKLIDYLIKLGPIYSLYPEVFLSGAHSFIEIGYDLEKVLNPNSYPNKKKRYQRLIYPFKQLERYKVKTRSFMSSEVDSNVVKLLHDEWVEHKLADPNTFKIMFPTNRYIRCYDYAIQHVGYFVYCFCMAKQLIAVRVVGIQKDIAYDLANFGKYWELPSNMMEWLDIYVLRDLYQRGMKKFNCGAQLNKNLSLFKTHYPSYEVKSYMYSQIKVKEEQKGFF